MNRNTFISNLSWLLMLTIGLFSYSCTTDVEDEPLVDSAEEIDFRGFGEEGDHRCFSLVFPITLVFPDGSTVEVGDRQEFKEAVRTYHESHPGERFRPKFQFPFDVTLKDGSTITLENRRQLKALIKECKKDRDPKHSRCYKLVFPITVSFPDGSTAAYNSPEEYKAGLKAWKKANPDATERPQIQFPYTVILKNGTEVTIENIEDQQELKMNCRKHRRHQVRKHTFKKDID